MYSFRLPEARMDQLRDRADSKEQSVTEIVLDLIESFLDKGNEPSDRLKQGSPDQDSTSRRLPQTAIRQLHRIMPQGSIVDAATTEIEQEEFQQLVLQELKLLRQDIDQLKTRVKE